MFLDQKIRLAREWGLSLKPLGQFQVESRVALSIIGGQIAQNPRRSIFFPKFVKRVQVDIPNIGICGGKSNHSFINQLWQTSI